MKLAPCCDLKDSPYEGTMQQFLLPPNHLVIIHCDPSHLCVWMQVFESQSSYKPQGSVIALAVNCQYALEAIHPDLLAR